MSVRTVFVVAPLAALALSAAAHAATTPYVALCGSNGWVGVSSSCAAPLGPKRTIQAAIDASLPGDTVVVLPGTYVEAIDLDGDGTVGFGDLLVVLTSWS